MKIKFDALPCKPRDRNKEPVIVVGGQLANGKDIFCDYLAEAMDGKWIPHLVWTRNAFAKAVKKVFMDAFKVDAEFIEKWKRIPEPPPGFDLPLRDCLILIGDGFRKMKANIWIETAFRLGTSQIISDCRYVNEAIAVRKKGGIAVLLWRPGHENNIQNGSEQELMPYVNYLRDINLTDGEIPQDLIVPESYWQQKTPLWKALKDYLIMRSPSITYKLKMPEDRHIPFHLWIKNDGTKEDLYRKIDNTVIPYIINHYEMYDA